MIPTEMGASAPRVGPTGPTRPTKLGTVPIRNTSKLFTPDTRVCMLVYAHPKRGKTRLGATLDKLTRAHLGKPTLVIGIEAGDGGGTMSIQDYDIDFVNPKSMEEVNQVIAALATDRTYGGVVFDSATEYVKRFLKPYALKFPYLKGTPSATRLEGVPEQGDYQTMGERARMDFNKLINLTTAEDLNVRKHLIVTALEREKTDRKTGELVSVGPDLPGAMSTDASSMFQTVATIEIRTSVEPGPEGKNIRVSKRVLVTDATEDNKRIIGDRTKRIPSGVPLDMLEVWEKFWVPTFGKKEEVV